MVNWGKDNWRKLGHKPKEHTVKANKEEMIIIIGDALGNNSVIDKKEMRLYLERKNNFLKHGKFLSDEALETIYPHLIERTRLQKIKLYIKKIFC